MIEHDSKEEEKATSGDSNNCRSEPGLTCREQLAKAEFVKITLSQSMTKPFSNAMMTWTNPNPLPQIELKKLHKKLKELKVVDKTCWLKEIPYDWLEQKVLPACMQSFEPKLKEMLTAKNNQLFYMLIHTVRGYTCRNKMASCSVNTKAKLKEFMYHVNFLSEPEESLLFREYSSVQGAKSLHIVNRSD
ncbi:hypothetical protein RFI_06391 [Reticulomyxa filosa]|uniref:Uncharacterized protein n=1 Tax=Reticulomyxa filosa TaxID=46433 RepID=X6NY21_RETFI|nr:hypothetical protein RFI_06391 [Reticulomyxa filosa]|eukprot:ETO30729.1 hypothetical protein RFI_06391 [Reticulomyxa filosa]